MVYKTVNKLTEPISTIKRNCFDEPAQNGYSV